MIKIFETNEKLTRLCSSSMDVFTVAETAQHAANRKNTCKLRKQLPQFYNAVAARWALSATVCFALHVFELVMWLKTVNWTGVYLIKWPVSVYTIINIYSRPTHDFILDAINIKKTFDSPNFVLFIYLFIFTNISYVRLHRLKSLK